MYYPLQVEISDDIKTTDIVKATQDNWVIFLWKKYLLVGASDMLWTGQWVSQWVRDVCMSHQSDWMYYKQPIKFLFLVKRGNLTLLFFTRE